MPKTTHATIVRTYHNVSIHVDFSDQGRVADAYLFVDDENVLDVGCGNSDGVKQSDIDFMIDNLVGQALVFAEESGDDMLRMSLMRAEPYIL